MAEQGTLTPEQMNELLFMQIVMMFQTAAYQHMGKVMNPATQKVERNLDQAKDAIDILGMLDEKTRGNLNDNEKGLLEHTLFELRMNYVDEMNKGEEPGAQAEGEASGPEAPASETGEPEPEAPDSEKPEAGESA